MKEAFDLIKERLEESSMVTFYFDGKPPKQCVPIEDALFIVSEVEAEFGKDINVRGNPKTNADRIRSMSDEEFARFLCEQGFCVDERCPRLWDEINCVECIMEWLKSEVK